MSVSKVVSHWPICVVIAASIFGLKSSSGALLALIAQVPLVIFFLRMIFAITDCPATSLEPLPPRIISIFSTCSTGILIKAALRPPDFEVGRDPSINTFPALPPKPRSFEPPSNEKPAVYLSYRRHFEDGIAWKMKIDKRMNYVKRLIHWH